MQTGLSLQELAGEIQRIEEGKKDFVAPTTKLWAATIGDPNNGGVDGIELEVEGNGRFDIGNVAHEQIGDRLGIPRKYYQRMQAEAPDLLTTNINCWMRKQPENRMVRTLDGRVRAFLSDRFRPLDNYMVANAALPVLYEHAQNENLLVKSCQVTERRMYIQAVYPKIQEEVRVGDVIQAGIVLSNSEVGCGAFAVELLLYRLACLNGMIRGSSFRKHHVGRRIDTGDEVNQDFYRTETVEADNRAFMMKVEDTVRHSFDELAFKDEVKLLRESAENEIPVKAVESTVKEITKRMSFTETEGDGILGHLIKGGDLTQYGLANAVTRLAHDASNYDRCVELEKLGGKIIDLTSDEWGTVTKH